ncbi:MAG: ABC transporter substrate-binding protein [Armatimonadetes bacterium]|nr:ABC transporter substrate-binding protein [Armatimonadota bacterium]
MRLSRWWRYGAVAVVAFLLFAGIGTGSAQQAGKVVVNGYGGAWDKHMTEQVIKPFEQRYNIKVELIPLFSAEAFTRLRATKGRPDLDVVVFSGGQEIPAFREGLIDRLDPKLIPNMNRVYSLARFKDDISVIAIFATTAIIYNTEKIQRAPTSFKDFWRPEFKGRVTIPDMTNTSGVEFLLMAAKVNGAKAAADIEPGFKALAELKPNLVTAFGKVAQMEQLFTQGSAWMTWYSNTYAADYKAKGLPVGFAVPREGASATQVTINLVKDAPSRENAIRFINWFLDATPQAAFSRASLYAPTNRDAKLPPDVAAKVISYGEENIKKLVPTDWEVVNRLRADWTKRWNELMAR